MRTFSLFSILLILVVHIVFASLLRHEIWDGTIFDYWLATHDFRGIEEWYRSSNGYITLLIMKAINSSNLIVDLIYKLHLFNILAIVLYPLGAFMFLRFVCDSQKVRLLAVLIISLSPIFLLYASIMNALIMIYIAFCWIGLSLLERPGGWKVLALILIAISCQLWSNYAVLVTFLGWRILVLRSISIEFILALLVGSLTIYFLLFHFELSGPYTGYNAFVFTTVGALLASLLNSSFIIGILPVLILYVGLTVLYACLARRIVVSHWMGILGVLLFYTTTLVPYVLVGKPPPDFGLLFGVYGTGEFVVGDSFDYRHLLPAYPWIALAMAASTMRVFDVSRLYLRDRPAQAVTLLGAAALLSSNVINLTDFGHHIFKRDVETVSLVATLAETCTATPGEVCTLDIANASYYRADAPRQYELNYLYFEAFGKLGVVELADSPGSSREFTRTYACASERQAIAYLTPYETCKTVGE